MSFEQYSRVHHPLPYVLDVHQGKGRLIYFGFKHSRDPSDPQFVTLRKLWVEEKPQLVLNEDISAVQRATLEESIRYDGERGALAFWAKQDHVPMRSIDMRWRDEFMVLQRKMGPMKVKMFYLIRGLEQDLRRPSGAGVSTDVVAQRILDMFRNEGIDFPPHSIEDVDRYWPVLRIKGDWRKPSIAWIDPTGNGSLSKVSRRSSEIRDAHMVSVLTDELKKGKRILAVVGASHVVMQEPALPGVVKRISGLHK